VSKISQLSEYVKTEYLTDLPHNIQHVFVNVKQYIIIPNHNANYSVSNNH